ncbi:hypothetical protein ABH981_006262 [Bradyrhizobium ottawaense]
MGDDLLEALAEHFFVHGIGIGVKESHRDALNAGLLQPGHQALDLRLFQRLQHPSLVIEALGEPEAALRRHERRRFRRNVETVEIAAAITRDLEHIGKSLGRDQRHLRQSALDDGVGHARGAVDEAPDLASAQAHRLDRLQHRLNRSVGARRHLCNPRLR